MIDDSRPVTFNTYRNRINRIEILHCLMIWWVYPSHMSSLYMYRAIFELYSPYKSIFGGAAKR